MNNNLTSTQCIQWIYAGNKRYKLYVLWIYAGNKRYERYVLWIYAGIKLFTGGSGIYKIGTSFTTLIIILITKMFKHNKILSGQYKYIYKAIHRLGIYFKYLTQWIIEKIFLTWKIKIFSIRFLSRILEN